ncbi:hypothetical protein ACLOJK_032455 [Asimina triloba]
MMQQAASSVAMETLDGGRPQSFKRGQSGKLLSSTSTLDRRFNDRKLEMKFGVGTTTSFISSHQGLLICVRTREEKTMKTCRPSTKLERKVVEKNRRMQMKTQCFKLASLVPYYNPKDALSQQDQVDLAAEYIKKLQMKIEELKRKRDIATTVNEANGDMRGATMVGLRLPVVEVKELDSALEVVLISGSERNFMTCDVICILQEEGVDVVNATISFVADRVIHVIHAQVSNSRVGFESERVYQKLKDLVIC